MPKKQKYPHLLGSKWTAKQKTWGWRHFQVVNRQNRGQWVFAELVASCDPTVRFWINAKQLQDANLWQSGWQTLTELSDAPLIKGDPPAYRHPPYQGGQGGSNLKSIFNLIITSYLNAVQPIAVP